MILKVLIDFESFIEVFEEEEPQPKTGLSRTLLEMHFSIYQQFARRIIFHQPSLFMKSLERVSFKDPILSDDFSMEDLVIFFWSVPGPFSISSKVVQRCDFGCTRCIVSRYGCQRWWCR